MNQIWLIIVIPAVISLLVNEFCDISPWLAKKLVPCAAKLWSLDDPDTAEVLAEEWAAVIDDAPGKLTKLGQAILFLGQATLRFQRARFDQMIERLITRILAGVAKTFLEQTLARLQASTSAPHQGSLYNVHGKARIVDIGRKGMIVEHDGEQFFIPTTPPSAFVERPEQDPSE